MLPAVVGISHVAPSLHSQGYAGFENPGAYVTPRATFAGFENPGAYSPRHRPSSRASRTPAPTRRRSHRRRRHRSS